MKLSPAESDHLGIEFVDAREAKILRPAIYGEIKPRAAREAFSQKVNDGLLQLRMGEDHDPIVVSVPLDRLRPVAEYMLEMFDRHPAPAVKDTLAEAYEQLSIIADALDAAKV